jgi:hypothetical protein
MKELKKNAFARVRERTIPTERPPLVREVSANCYGCRVPRGQRNGSLRPYSTFLDRYERIKYLNYMQL